MDRFAFFDYFSVFDYCIIGLYFAFLICLGFYLQRRASASLEDYFLGGKKLPWWALGVSGMAWSLDITGTMLIVSFLYMLGPRGLFIEFRGGANLILIFMLLWTGKWHRRSGCMTGAEWNIYRFGSGLGAQFARLSSALVMVVVIIGMLAYMVKGVGLFLATFLPLTPFTCALVLVAVATIYTIASGFYGVVFTDLFQAGIIIVAVLGVTVIAVNYISDYDGTLAELAARVTGNKRWISSVPHTYVELPKGYENYRFLTLIAGFYLLRNIMSGIGSGADSRYFGARNERECGMLTFFWSCLMTFRWPMMIGFAVMGLLLVDGMFSDQSAIAESCRLIKQHIGDLEENRWNDQVASIINSPEKHPDLIAELKAKLGEDDWKTKVKMIGYHETINPERILPMVLLKMIPAGFRGLLFVALIAASMSTFDYHVNFASAFFTKDIYQAYIAPEASNRELISVSWAFGIAIVILGFTMAYYTKNIHEIWDWIIMGLGAGVAMPGILRLYWWRFNAGGFVIGLVVGMVSAVLQRALYPDMDTYTKFLVLTAISLTGTIIGTYLTPPTPRKVLEHFYKTTRPFGFWAPFKNTLSPDQWEATRREHFYDLICVPIGLTWQVSMFMLPMLLIIRNYQAFCVTLVIFLTALAGMYKLWYKNLPPAIDGVVNPGTVKGKVVYYDTQSKPDTK